MTSQSRYLTVFAMIENRTGRASQPVKGIKTVFSEPRSHAEMNLLSQLDISAHFFLKRALGAAFLSV